MLGVGIELNIKVMLRAFSAQLGAAATRAVIAKEVARPSLTYASTAAPLTSGKSLIAKYELIYQSEQLSALLKVESADSLINEILNCERKNKTARKVAKKHRKKKGKTVNLRRC